MDIRKIKKLIDLLEAHVRRDPGVVNRRWSFAQLLLDHGADVNVRCSLRTQLHPGYGKDEVMREYRDVTPLAWGRRFHRKEFVNGAALALIEAGGGAE